MNHLAIFDLDGTIIPNPSSEKQFFFWLLRHGYIKLPQVWQSLLFTIKWLKHFKQEIFVKNKAYLFNLPVDEINELAINFTQQELLPKIRSALAQRITAHHQNNDTVILLTGTIEPIAQVFAKHLNFDECYPAICACKDNRFVNSPPIQHPYKMTKLTIAHQICAKHNADINTIINYGNSIHDLPLLQVVGTPIAVTPDRKLKRIALNRGWEIINP